MHNLLLKMLGIIMKIPDDIWIIWRHNETQDSTIFTCWDKQPLVYKWYFGVVNNT